MAEKIVNVWLSVRQSRKHPQLIYELESGQRIAVGLKTLYSNNPDDVQVAQEVYDRKRRQIALGLLDSAKEISGLRADLPLHEFERQFIAHRRKLAKLDDISPLSVNEDLKAFKVLKKTMGHDAHLSGINAEFVKVFVNKLRSTVTCRKKLYSNQTINKYLRTLAAAFNWAISQKYMTGNPFAAFGKLKTKRPQEYINVMRDEEIEAFKQWFADVPHARWQLPAFLFALNTLCRAGSILRLKYSDIYTTNIDGVPTQFVHLIEKRKTERDVPLNSEALRAVEMMRDLATAPDAILQHLQKNKSIDEYRQLIADGYVFFPATALDTLSKMMHRASTRLRHSGQISSMYKFHDLRDTGATYLLENGVSIETVSFMLGHSSIKTTQEYYAKLTSRMAARNVRHLSGVMFDTKNTP